jgi:hypothetical protein
MGVLKALNRPTLTVWPDAIYAEKCSPSCWRKGSVRCLAQRNAAPAGVLQQALNFITDIKLKPEHDAA